MMTEKCKDYALSIGVKNIDTLQRSIKCKQSELSKLDQEGAAFSLQSAALSELNILRTELQARIEKLVSEHSDLDPYYITKVRQNIEALDSDFEVAKKKLDNYTPSNPSTRSVTTSGSSRRSSNATVRLLAHLRAIDRENEFHQEELELQVEMERLEEQRRQSVISSSYTLELFK